MSINPLASKIASPYARALYDFSVEHNIMHQVTADFQNLYPFLVNVPTFLKYLSNPGVSTKKKELLLTKTLKDKLNLETFKFLMLLVKRNRINLLSTVILNYLTLVYKTASITPVKVCTAYPLSAEQKLKIINKLKKLTNSREVRLVIEVDEMLIGGFSIEINSNIIDFTIRTRFINLAKHLNFPLYAS
jgi:F-type H+-transporting ATPase subunit delta